MDALVRVQIFKTFFIILLSLRYIDYVDGSIMTDGSFYDVAGQAFGAVSNKTKGRNHKLFCTQCQAFAPCTELLHNKKASQKLGIGCERSALGPKQFMKLTPVVKKVRYCWGPPTIHYISNRPSGNFSQTPNVIYKFSIN